MKPREVWCPNCKVYITSSEPAPVCECGNQMITVIYRLSDGQRLTGNDKLALRLNEHE